MCSCIEAARNERGQATVEAAFLIPVLFITLLLLLQPAILLYDRMVMNAAAAEACRMLVTRSSATGLSEDEYKDAVLRHLGAIPQQENFHVHEGGCTWEVLFEGDETSGDVGVSISTEVKPLPLLDVGSALMGLTNAAGNLEVKVHVVQPAQDDWVKENSLGMDPGAWVEKWR